MKNQNIRYTICLSDIAEDTIQGRQRVIWDKIKEYLDEHGISTINVGVNIANILKDINPSPPCYQRNNKTYASHDSIHVHADLDLPEWIIRCSNGHDIWIVDDIELENIVEFNSTTATEALATLHSMRLISDEDFTSIGNRILKRFQFGISKTKE